MPWNGSGVFRRIYSWVADAAAGIDISSVRTDTDTNDITVNGFGNCLTRDGQGSATANLPMNGFRHTGVGNGVNPTDYIAVGQLQPGGTRPGIIGIADLGDLKATAMPESLLPAGWRICAGQTRPRTDPLWIAASAVWSWGPGDGSTTYTLPDLRGRLPIGKDNMGGAAANRVTNGVSGIAGTTLGAVGGDQSLQQHNHTASSVDSGHTHIATDSGHGHTATDSGHVHQNTVAGGVGGSTSLALNTSSIQSPGVATASGTANITVGTGTANVTNASGAANITTTIGNAGAGVAQNMPPGAIVNYIIYVGA